MFPWWGGRNNLFLFFLLLAYLLGLCQPWMFPGGQQQHHPQQQPPPQWNPTTKPHHLSPFPSFPETPQQLAQEVATAILSYIRHHGPCSRVRVDLGLSGLCASSDDDEIGGWRSSRELGHVPFYEEVLVGLLQSQPRPSGQPSHGKLLAIFNHREDASLARDSLAFRRISGIQFDFLHDRGDSWVDVGRGHRLLLFLNPVVQTPEDLTEFQRVVAVASLRGIPIAVINPEVSPVPHFQTGDYCLHLPPTLLNDFHTCFHLSSHTYRHNTALAYALLARHHHWEIYLRDGRLPGSGWAFAKTVKKEPSELRVEQHFFDSFVVTRGGEAGKEVDLPGEEEADPPPLSTRW